jgi:hypothetical protein
MASSFTNVEIPNFICTPVCRFRLNKRPPGRG